MNIINNMLNKQSAPNFTGAVSVHVLRNDYTFKTAVAKEHVLANKLLNNRDTLVINLPNLDRVLFVDGKERKMLQPLYNNEQNALSAYFARDLLGDAIKEVRREIKKLKSPNRRAELAELRKIRKSGLEALKVDRREYSVANPDGSLMEFNKRTPLQRRVIERYNKTVGDAKEVITFARNVLNRAAKDIIANPTTVKVDIP